MAPRFASRLPLPVAAEAEPGATPPDWYGRHVLLVVSAARSARFSCAETIVATGATVDRAVDGRGRRWPCCATAGCDAMLVDLALGARRLRAARARPPAARASRNA